MKNRDYNKNDNNNENSQERIVIIPPEENPFIHGHGPGQSIPPWGIPGGPGPVVPPLPPPGMPGQPNQQGNSTTIPNFPPIPQQQNQNILIVKIKSVFENTFVLTGPNNYLYATGANANQGSTFRIIMLQGNTVILRAENQNFIRLNDRDILVADTDRNRATRFLVYQTNDREYVLRAPNGNYVRVRERDNVLVARAENPGPRTILKFRNVN